MHIDILLKPFKKRQGSSGYTLTELLIGGIISAIVIGAAGTGLMYLLQGNKTSTTEANRRTEVNRALEFISDETRKAETIETNPSTAFNTAKDDTSLNFDPIEGNTDPKDNAQPILALNIPGVSQPVLYYISPPESTAWKGPRVIYRFGPNFDNSGNYTDPTTPASWTAKPLIDRISDADSNPNCGGLTTASPSANAQGFYACIKTNGKTANLFAIAQLENDEDYRASTEVYARAEAENLTGNSSNKNFSGGGNPNPFNPGGQDTTYTVESIESAMGCNSSGAPCSMTITFKKKSDNTVLTTINPGQTTANFTTNEEFYVEVTPSTSGVSNPYPSSLQNNTNPVTSSTNTNEVETNQVMLLGDGFDPPSNPAWNPTGDDPNNPTFNSIATILANTINTNNENRKFIENRKITLPEKQYLLAFEIGQTDPTHPGFDLQDQVLLITVQ